MKRYRWILMMLFSVLLIGCEDSFNDGGNGSPTDGITEGMTKIKFAIDDLPVIITRAGETTTPDEPIENALMMVFKPSDTGADSVLVNSVYQQLSVDNSSVNIYLNASENPSIYAICNISETLADEIMQKAVIGKYTLKELYQESVKIAVPDGAYSGKHIMTGGMTLPLTTDNKLLKEYTINIKRLTAQLNFEILFNPINDGDEFALGEVYIHQVPMGSMLFDQGITYIIDPATGKPVVDDKSWGVSRKTAPDAAKEDSLDICRVDYSYIKAGATTTADERLKHFYKKDGKSGIWLDYTTHENPGGHNSYSASFQMFENRQGRVYDVYDNWDELQGLIGKKENCPEGYEDLYAFYQQGKKRGLVGADPDGLDRIFKRNDKTNTGKYTVNKEEEGFPCATYLTIRGIYTRKVMGNDDPVDVTYHVYLGSDNYKDFNVCRNHLYNYQITIMAVDKTDTRVDATPIGGMTLFGNFDRILDSHPDVMQVLFYSPSEWRVRVSDPDATPWLELSESPVYLPRHAGESEEGRARFQISGGPGMHYIYLHADEFIPKISKPVENGRDQKQIRKGDVIFENRANTGKLITVQQYAAQMVVCHIKYDIHLPLAGDIRDTFFVENILEKKNMSWGFHKYWSFLTDDRIGAGQWDGLANTRILYHVAYNGDKWDVPPAYPADKYPNGLPTNEALGYAINKNRDRNGNGKIDVEEILWYWPAANEIQAFSGHLNGGSNYYDADNAETIVMDWEMEPMNFHSSSPSSADPAGITTGFCYSVLVSPNQKKSGKKSIVQRTRLYNVICARRYNGWIGEDTGEVEGDITTDENWGEDDEQIMDKEKKQN